MTQKRVLVVSDNATLTRVFVDVWRELRIHEIAEVKFRYSHRNKDPRLLEDLGARRLNLREADGLALAMSFDVVFSIHCKQLFPPELVRSRTCVNLHPGHNPEGRGWYPQVFSIIESRPAGATLHVMDEKLDAGLIIARLRVPTYSHDTSLELYERIQQAEGVLLRRHLREVVEGKFSAFPPESEGEIRTSADFRRLCRLDLDSRGTLREHLDLLRALSHGEFENAYYETADGGRVYVRVALSGLPPDS